MHSREGDQVVSLVNEPIDEPATDEARRLVPIHEIEDWQVVVSSTTIRGGYTIGALQAIAQERGYSLPPKQRRLLAAFVDLPGPGCPHRSQHSQGGPVDVGVQKQ